MATESGSTIEALLEEQRLFASPEEFAKNAYVNDDAVFARAAADPEAFWASVAEELHWFKQWDQVLDESDPPFFKWFVGGKLNITYNCIDRHLDSWRRNKAAIIWEGEPGDQAVLTYYDLWREVSKFANALKGLGVKKGDRVTLYMGMVPELAIAMLACARIGAPHSIVFGGFSAEALADRINDAQGTVLVTCDGGWRRGGIVPLKQMADEAVERCPTIENVVVVKRIGDEADIAMKEGRDHWWHDLMENAGLRCEPEEMDAEDMLYILYTSGTTGKPKGIVHTTGGYSTQTYLTTKWVFDMKDDDVYWCTADIGWVTGHSYIIYGPLQNGATTVMYEGAPDFPGTRPLLGRRGEVWCHHTLHRADRYPRLHALGRRLSGDARHVEPAPAGLGWRTHQPRSLDLVPQEHWRRTLSDCGYVVADRDRRYSYHTACLATRRPNPVRQRGLSPASPRRSWMRPAMKCRKAAATL